MIKYRFFCSVWFVISSAMIPICDAHARLLFSDRVDYLAGDGPWSVETEDFNGDGKLDLAVANIYGDDISIFLGNGDGTFPSYVRYDAGD